MSSIVAPGSFEVRWRNLAFKFTTARILSSLDGLSLNRKPSGPLRGISPVKSASVQNSCGRGAAAFSVTNANGGHSRSQKLANRVHL
jgi:hypothetical protein